MENVHYFYYFFIHYTPNKQRIYHRFCVIVTQDVFSKGTKRTTDTRQLLHGRHYLHLIDGSTQTAFCNELNRGESTHGAIEAQTS